MPPKPKFTKEEVIATSIALIAEKGAESFSAREIAEKLGTSVSPIFTAFGNMDSLESEVRKALMCRFNRQLKKASEQKNGFKEMGICMIRFAKEEPELFKALFMSRSSTEKEPDVIFGSLGEMEGFCINLIQRDYGLEREDSIMLFQHIWTYTYGISTMCASGVCTFPDELISMHLQDEFLAQMVFIKMEKEKGVLPFLKKKMNLD